MGEIGRMDKMERCRGCVWRMPHKFGGNGFICDGPTKDGKCPECMIRWALWYGENTGRGRVAFATDEDLLNCLRM